LTHHRCFSQFQARAGKMGGIQTTGAGSVQSQTGPVEIIEPAQSIGQHSRASACGRVPEIYLQISRYHGIIFSGEAADMDRRIGSNCSGQRNTGYA